MALDKTLVDIPTTGGIDTKTDSVNDTPPALADLKNLRFTHTGAYDPRNQFDELQNLTATETGFIAEGRDAIFSEIDGALYRTTSVDHDNIGPMWAPLGKNFILGGNHVALGGGVAVDKPASATLTDGTTFCTWQRGGGAFAHQTISASGEFLSAGLQDVTTPGYILPTAGPSGAGFVWVTNSGTSALSGYRVDSSGVTLLTIPALTVGRFSITYSSTDTCWYVAYESGGTATIAKWTISGTTVSSVASTALVGSFPIDLDIIRTTTYVVAAYWVSTDITVKYFNTSLVLQNTQTRTPTVGTVHDYVGFGICEAAADQVICNVTTSYDDLGPALHTFKFTPTTAATIRTNVNVGFIAPGPPIYLDGKIYVYAVDATFSGTQSSCLLLITDLTGGTEAVFDSTVFWAAEKSYTPAIGIVAAWYTTKYRMSKTAASLVVPYQFLATFNFNTTTTSGNSAGVASSQIETEYAFSQSAAAAMVLSLTESPPVVGYSLGTSSILTTPSMRAIDGAGQGPASVWPVPFVYQKALTTGGVLTTNSQFIYVYVKTWVDSLGNTQRLETFPVFVNTITVGADVYNKYSVYFSPSAFQVYNPVTSQADDAVIEIYRTETNGAVPFYLATLTSATPMPYVDSTSDASLTQQFPLASAGGELTATVPTAARASTVWKGRLAILPYDNTSEIFYTKPIESQVFPAFASGLSISIPQTSSELSALGAMDGVLYAFTRNQVYTIYGDPAGNTGEGSTLTLPEIRFNGVGCEDPASVLLTPLGLFFKSDKGVYVILRNQELSFVGAGPFDERDQKVIGAWTNQDTSEMVYALDNSEFWIYDWGAKSWGRWTPPVDDGDEITGATLVNAKMTYISPGGISQETTADVGEDFEVSATTAWIRLGELQGYQRVYNVWVYLDYLEAHTLTVDLYIDGKETSVYTWAIASTSLGSTAPEQIRLSMPIQKCSAFKLKFSSANAGWKLRGLTAEIGVKPNSRYRNRNTPNNY